jgi:hypothetical protein
MPHKLHICILFCMPYPSNMAASSCQLNTNVNCCLFHITSKLECRQVNVWTFKLLKKFKSLDIAFLPLELKEVLLVHPSLWRWLKMDKNWGKYGVWKWCSIWNNKCSIWQGEHLGLKILNHRSIASRNERGIVKLKLEHPYHFRSLKMIKNMAFKICGVGRLNVIFFKPFVVYMFIFFVLLLHCSIVSKIQKNI